MAELVHSEMDAQVIFKNFSGRETQYNKEGDRNFGLIIRDDAQVQEMISDGWNVKWLEPLDEGDQKTPWLPVTVSFKYKPPKVWYLGEDETGALAPTTRVAQDIVGELDYADILYTDVLVRGSRWEVNGKTGVKAYLQTMMVQIMKDPVEAKYFNY